MAYTTIDDPSKYFQTMIYTGNGAVRSLTNDGNSDLQPDWIWVKRRDATGNHNIIDSTRGVTKLLFAQTSDDEETLSDRVTSFDSDGFSTANEDANTNTGTFVAWQWKANGGTTSTNDDGNIDTTVQANTTAGFSIATWTGANSTATLGHGLGAVPEMIISKARDSAQEWGVYHKDVGNDDYLHLNETAAEQDNAAYWNDTTPTSTVWSVGNAGPTNRNTSAMLAYVFTPIQGYSKFGSYTGNANADGVFVYLGFSPAWLMVKNTESANVWQVYDNKRGMPNPNTHRINIHTSDAESGTSDSERMDFLSNGFKMRDSSGNVNSAHKYIYMAFAESPFVSSKGVPTTAR